MERSCAWLEVVPVLLVVLSVVVLSAASARAQPAPAPVANAADEPVSAAHRLFATGDLVAGRKLLVDACAEHRRDHPAYGRLLLELAYFYEKYVGDYRYVKGDLKEISGLRLAPDDPTVLAAAALRRRLESLAAEFAEQDEVLARVRVYQSDPELLRERVAELHALISRQPGYYRLAAAYHYLGESLLGLERYSEAHRAFSRAIALRPAIKLSLPTEQRQAEAYEKWVRTDLGLAAWIVLGAALLFAAVLFFWSRPWRHLGRRHALVLAGMLAAWWGLFRLAVVATEGLASRAPTNAARPIEVQTGLGGELSEPLGLLFRHGLVGACGVLLFAFGTARFRPRWTWVAINATFGLVLLASLTTRFALRYADVPFVTAAGRHYPYLGGTFHYTSSTDLDPFLLTNPRAHCAFQQSIRNLDEENLKRWFGSYAKVCPMP
jgi:tetratricopeptide (TPR) repeat protein